MTRVWYKDEDVPARHTVPIHKGDVLVMNNEYAQYKAETQIALQDLENNGRVNVVGHVAPTDMMLLETLQPWSDFRMIEALEPGQLLRINENRPSRGLSD
ncbi:hypothetical protein PLO_1092 [Pediococcus acidilactici NGRI 0510Q]|nr:hypothetical protein PLO_1092 [Pediococcus acidilactici NGRI 0510Q]